MKTEICVEIEIEDDVFIFIFICATPFIFALSICPIDHIVEMPFMQRHSKDFRISTVTH